MSSLITSSSSSLPFASLIQKLDEKALQLPFLIAYLTPLNPLDIQSFEDLVQKVKCLSVSLSNEQIKSIDVLVKNLIFKQFSHPDLESVREVISNAIDSHMRANQAHSPISIDVKNGQLCIQDEGDGMGWSNLVHFFVPGRSSNAKAIFKLEEGIPAVTGRFGQGGLAPFYFLYPKGKSILPYFSNDKETINLTIAYEINEQLYQVTFTINREGIIEHSQSFPLLIPKRKISIHTRHGNESIKMKFRGENNKIFVDIQQKHKEIQGTYYKISSDLIQENRLSLSIRKTFQSVKTPLLLNGHLIHSHEAVKEMRFPEGTLTYTFSSYEQEKGILRICEGGKLIVEFVIRKSVIPQTVTLDFNRLSLTQERASLDFKDVSIRQAIQKLIETIWQAEDLSLLEKGALLNAFYPILGPKKFNLFSQISGLIACSSVLCLPNNHKLKILMGSEAMYLNGHYFSSIALPIFHETSFYKLYLVKSKASLPFVMIELDNQSHLFLNDSYFKSDSIESFHYNLVLLNLWLKNKDLPFTLYLPSLIPQTKHFTIPPFAQVAQQIPALNFDESKYDTLPNAEKILYKSKDFVSFIANYAYPHPQQISQRQGFEEYLFSLMDYHFLDLDKKEKKEKGLQISQKASDFLNQLPKQQKDSLEKLYKNIPSKLFITLKVHAYLYDLHLFFPEIIHCFNSHSIEKNFLHAAITKIIDYPIFLTKIHAHLIEIYSFLVVLPAREQKEYLTFFLKSNKKCSIKEQQKQFSDVQPFLNQLNCDDETRLKFWECADIENLHSNLSQFFSLLPKICNQTNRNQLLNYAHLLQVENLLTFQPRELENFLSIYSEKFISIKGKKEGYQHALHFLQSTAFPLSVMKQWIDIYLRGYEVENQLYKSIYLKVSFNMNAFFSIIQSYVNENHLTQDELFTICKQFENFLENISHFNTCIKAYEVRFRYSSISENLTIEQCVENLSETDSLPLLPNLNRKQTSYVFLFLNNKSDLYRNKPKISDPLNEFLRQTWEQCGYISTDIRPFLYACLLDEECTVESQKVDFPVNFEENKFIGLHQDDAVSRVIGSAELAAIRIQGAMKQTNQEFFFVREICKNSQEAAATKIEFEIYEDTQKGTFVCIKDNGKGMDLEGLKALRIPGYTTKQKETEDPNFGWGFFTIFREFNEVIIQSSTDGSTSYFLYLKKVNESLIMQIQTLSQPCSIGTTLTLKTNLSTPLINLIKLKSELVSSCQYMKNIDLFFQKQKMNHDIGCTVLVEEKGEDLNLQIGQGEEGIYCKQLRVGDLTDQMLVVLPSFLKDFLEKEKWKIRLFLPHSEQIMNRQSLVEKEGFLEKVQLLIFKSSVKAYVKCWQKNPFSKASYFNLLSEDDWNKFDYFRDNSDTHLYSFFTGLEQENKMMEMEEKNKLALIDNADQFFKKLNQQIPISFKKGTQAVSFQDLFSEFFKEANFSKDKQRLNQISSDLSHKDCFISLLISLPLQDQSMSFRDIQNFIIKNLKTFHFLDEENGYDYAYIISLNAKKIRSDMQQCFDLIQENLDEDFVLFLNKFEESITSRLLGINQQTSIAEQERLKSIKSSPAVATLSLFLKALAQRFWNKEIEVKFYSKTDGTIAHTYRGSNQLFVNLMGDVDLFKKFYDNWQAGNESFTSDQMQVLMKWIDTLTHELTHMAEESDCAATHDANFKNRMAKQLVPLFIQQQQDSHVLNILYQLFDKSLEPQLKKIKATL